MKKRSPDFPKLTRNILTPLITSVDERETNMGTSFFASVSFLVLSKCLQHACIVQTKRLSITFVGILSVFFPRALFFSPLEAFAFAFSFGPLLGFLAVEIAFTSGCTLASTFALSLFLQVIWWLGTFGLSFSFLQGDMSGGTVDFIIGWCQKTPSTRLPYHFTKQTFLPFHSLTLVNRQLTCLHALEQFDDKLLPTGHHCGDFQPAFPPFSCCLPC